MRTRIIVLLLLGGGAAVASARPPTLVISETPQTGPQRVRLSAAQMFALAEASAAAGNSAHAEQILATLSADPDLHVRSEARFRLGRLLSGLGRHDEAARLYRQVLDEAPGAQPVRLALVQALEALGDEAGARKALREVQAGGLPPDVARFVDRYAAALRAQQPFGVSLDLALAPDSNINRATTSDKLGTVIGDFELDEDARQRSGLGASVRAQAFVRARLGETTNLLARTAASTDLYRESDFNDVALALSAGPEFRIGADRLTMEGGAAWRWFGGTPYSTTATLAATWLRPIGRRAQLRTTAGLGAVDNQRSNLQDGTSYALSSSFERALSERAGVGASLAIDRHDLRDPGYATTAGQLSLFGYRDVGAVTAVGALTLGRLEADARLFLFPERRVDRLTRASLTLTWRRFTLGNFAPLLRMTAERNISTVEIYDYRRLRMEIGASRAF